MNKLHKLLIAGFFAVLLSGGVVAQTNARMQNQPDQAAMKDSATNAPASCMMGGKAVDFQSVGASYSPARRAFVVIDSIDCSVVLLVRDQDSLRKVGEYVTDSLYKRHDLANILRPVSVGFLDDKIVFVAASKKDSSYLAILGMNAVDGTLPLISRVDMNCKSYAFNVSPCGREITVVGKNALGYNINIFNISEGAESLSADKCQPFGYRVPKQSERIQQSDPIGIGLTVVAVVVVFFALLIIALILMGYGNVLMKLQDRKSNKVVSNAAKSGVQQPIPANDSHTAGEVYAAIAAAIYMYNEELHDDEDTVITIQKVERAWTPWNAKFYNMNQYFNRSK